MLDQWKILSSNEMLIVTSQEVHTSGFLTQQSSISESLILSHYATPEFTSPAFVGVKIKSGEKPLSRACCATGEGITFLPLSLPEGGWVTMAAICTARKCTQKVFTIHYPIVNWMNNQCHLYAWFSQFPSHCTIFVDLSLVILITYLN